MPYIRKSWLSGFSEGLIALSGGRNGDIGVALVSGRQADAATALQEYMTLFGDRFYLELQRTGRADEEDYLHAAVELASQFSCPVVATNDVRFIDRGEFEAHEARVCIHEGRALDDPRRERRFSEQQYLRSAEEDGRTVCRYSRSARKQCGNCQTLLARVTSGRVFFARFTRFQRA